MSLGAASSARAQAADEFFRSVAGAAEFQATSLSDAELEGLRGRELRVAPQPAKGARKRIVLWDEARTPPHPTRLDAHNAIVIRGGAGVTSFSPGTTR